MKHALVIIVEGDEPIKEVIRNYFGDGIVYLHIFKNGKRNRIINAIESADPPTKPKKAK